MTNELLVLVVDDEPKVGELLKKIIEKKVKSDDKLEVHTVTSVSEAVKFVSNYSPDLVFLDIHMPEENGFDFLNQVDKKSFEVVFTTAYDQYAIEAINTHNCLMYLLKPIDLEEVQSAFDKYKEKAGYQYYYKIIKSNSKRILVKVEDIILCKAADNYCEIYVGNTKHLISKTLGAIESKIMHQNFMRLHRSYLVNMDYVSHIEKETKKIFFKKDLIGSSECLDLEIIASGNKLKDLNKWNL
ncbi:LytTR family DNA-binding domain-containing protein [Myroides pelagicus]|uniref:LytR/AlgR family response regulator transcription factor n=1 Tax=Myroides pelagicus TaxID=270914 RepID=UPI002DB69CF4|nr:LytTR family DNA-binding domain-containing protein [Myroides pelagicus]MEC4114341.1 LytTR family DNA-binding domain-containing protein [Myroides pelagicus]